MKRRQDSMEERINFRLIFIGLFLSLIHISLVSSPTGTPRITAPRVPKKLVRIKGRMPYLGSAAVEAHTWPSRKSLRPICRMAGRPATNIYTVMSRTQKMAVMPATKNTPFMKVSTKPLARFAFFISFSFLSDRTLHNNRNRLCFFPLKRPGPPPKRLGRAKEGTH